MLPSLSFQIPIHEKVIINLGEDSSDSDSDGCSSQRSAPRPPAGGRTDFLSSLDMFLKEARRTAEVRPTKHRSSLVPKLSCLDIVEMTVCIGGTDITN